MWLRYIPILSTLFCISRTSSFVLTVDRRLPNHLQIQSRIYSTQLRMASDKDIWASQKQLVEDMKLSTEKSLKEEMREKFAKRRLALVTDTVYLGFFIFCSLWTIFDNPFVALSYALGSTFGTMYAYGLGKYVETMNLGSEQTIESLNPVQGAGIGQARFAFFIMLFIFVGKFRSYGLLEIPSILGFFTYQIASLAQGLQEFDE